MGSQKSTYLICALDKASALTGARIMFLRHCDDPKTANQGRSISTNGKITFEFPQSVTMCFSRSVSAALTQSQTNPTHLFIDEIHFFDEEPTVHAILFAFKMGVAVFASGLKYDCYGAFFQTTLSVDSLASVRIATTGQCCISGCTSPSQHSALRDTKLTLAPTGKEVGGLEKYAPMCVEHFYGHLKENGIAAWPKPPPRVM